MIKIKKDYFKKNMVDLECNVKDYILNSEFNYVILENGVPFVWADNSPVVFGDENSAISELLELHIINEDNDVIPNNIRIMTEFEFLVEFCYNELVTILANEICNNDDNEYDGVCWIHWFDSKFYNLINIENTYIDILGAYVGEDGNLSFSVYENDYFSTFVSLYEFPTDIIYKIINDIL